MSENTTAALNKIISERINTVLTNVAKDFGISESDIAPYLQDNSSKTQKKFSGKECEQCMGRKQDGKQCTRKRRPGKEFCGKHENNRRYGRIDDDNNITVQNNSDIIRFVKKEINGSNYLIDSNNNVVDFTDIECPEFIGNYNGQTIVNCC